MYQVVFLLFRNWTTTVTFKLTDTFINSVRITVDSTPQKPSITVISLKLVT